MKHIIILFLFISLAACKSDPQAATKTPCDEISQKFTAILEKGTEVCQSNADCGCYGAMSPNQPCGGIIDAKTAEQLRPLENEFLKNTCPFYAACAPWMCQPVCVKNQCVNNKQFSK